MVRWLLVTSPGLCQGVGSTLDMYVPDTIACNKLLQNRVIEDSNHFNMLMDSVGQEFGQGTMGMACLCSAMSEASAGKA